jgi:phosphatidylglycerophosphate synthase
MPEKPQHIGDRRPIAARSWAISQQTARLLARWGVSPNGISLAGMVGGIAAGVALALTGPEGLTRRIAFVAAALLVQLRLLANMLDGMVAIESGRASPVGELYNEVPDRVSDFATLVGAGYAHGGDVALGYVAACVALFTAYIRAMGKAATGRQEFCGPMAKQQRMFVVTVVALYCGLAPEAWQPTDAAGRGLLAVGLAVIIVLGFATAVRRLWRVARHLRQPSQ